MAAIQHAMASVHRELRSGPLAFEGNPSGSVWCFESDCGALVGSGVVGFAVGRGFLGDEWARTALDRAGAASAASVRGEQRRGEPGCAGELGIAILDPVARFGGRSRSKPLAPQLPFFPCFLPLISFLFLLALFYFLLSSLARHNVVSMKPLKPVILNR